MKLSLKNYVQLLFVVFSLLSCTTEETAIRRNNDTLDPEVIEEIVDEIVDDEIDDEEMAEEIVEEIVEEVIEEEIDEEEMIEEIAEEVVDEIMDEEEEDVDEEMIEEIVDEVIDEMMEEEEEEEMTEDEIEEIVEEVVEEEIDDEEMAEEVIEVIVDEIIEEEIDDEEMIEEIAEEVVDEVMDEEEEDVDEEMIEEIVDEVIDEMMEEEAEMVEEEEEEEVTVLNGAVNTFGKLQVNGKYIYSEKTNDIVQLRGMSIFWSQWDEGSLFYHENVVQWLVEDWNINIIRAAMGVDAGDGGYVSNPSTAETETQKVYDIIDAAIENDIYVIVDWHSHYAHLNDPGSHRFAKEFFTNVYNKYGNIPNIIYEPFNEPLYNVIGGTSANDFATWTEIRPYHEAIIDTLRNLGAENLIICGTGIWSQALWEVIGDGYDNTIDDDNVAYTFHYYASSMYHDGLRDTTQEAISHGLPVFITEFGLTEESGNGEIDENDVQIWWDIVNENKLSWCNWSIANKDETSAAFLFNQSNLGRNRLTNPLSLEELRALTLSQSGNLVKEELQKN